jgi:hypothetical protein
MSTLDAITTLLIGTYTVAMFALAVEVIINVIKEVRDD